MARYTVQHGDSLWSIAAANKPTSMTTGEYWTKLKAANQGIKLFRGTKVNLPAVADAANAPGSNKSPVVTKGDSRNAPGSNTYTRPVVKSDARNAPGSNKSAPVLKTDARNAPGSNLSPAPKPDSRNAPGSNVYTRPVVKSDARNAPGSNADNTPNPARSPQRAAAEMMKRSPQRANAALAAALAAKSMGKKK